MLSLVKHTDIAEDRIWSDIDVSFSRHFTPSFTDQTFYQPSSEVNKIGNSYGVSSALSYDENGVVDDRIVSLRKPGLDISEVTEIVSSLASDTQSSIDDALKQQSQLAEEARKNDAIKQAQSEFISKLMNSPNPEGSKGE